MYALWHSYCTAHSCPLQAQLERTVRDTMLIEEGTGEYEYVWENCGNETYQLLPTRQWRFNISNYNSTSDASASKSTAAGRRSRGLLSTTLNVARNAQTRSNTASDAAWSGYIVAPLEDVYAVGFDEPFPVRDRVIFG
jgi:hypothetical protein